MGEDEREDEDEDEDEDEGENEENEEQSNTAVTMDATTKSRRAAIHITDNVAAHEQRLVSQLLLSPPPPRRSPLAYTRRFQSSAYETGTAARWLARLGALQIHSFGPNANSAIKVHNTMHSNQIPRRRDAAKPVALALRKSKQRE